MGERNNFSVPDTDGQDTPSSELDIYNQVIDSTVNDELLDEINLGLGYYSDSEYWQQVESFKHGLYADEAFSRRLRERAIEEAKRELALNGWNYYDETQDEVRQKEGWNDLSEEERQDADRRRYVNRRGEEIWSGLTEQKQYEALVETTGLTRDWIPPHWRMMMMRHEGSRSRGARLMDNAFGRVTEVKDETSELAKRRNKP